MKTIYKSGGLNSFIPQKSQKVPRGTIHLVKPSYLQELFDSIIFKTKRPQKVILKIGTPLYYFFIHNGWENEYAPFKFKKIYFPYVKLK